MILALVLTACTPGEESGERLLYFTPSYGANAGSALAVQTWQGEGEATLEQVLEDLLAGPTDEGLTNPFPRGVNIQEMKLKEGGVLHLTLSEQYSGLTDISRTLADACIVMTACQFPGIEAVEISSAGFWASAPASRILRPAQLELEALLP